LKRTKIFDHDFFDYVNLKETMIDGKRYYETPENKKYPSVTTVLSSVMDKTKLLQWSSRIGKEQADIIKTKAARRGTKFHKICEDYVLNKENFYLDHNPTTIDLFKQVQNFLDKNVSKVYGIEIPLYSNFLRTAGRSDMVCSLNGKNAIVDYKTSTKIKKEEWIKNYFLQLTTYGLMIEEMYQIEVPYITVVIACEDGKLQIFPKKLSEFKEEVIYIFRNFEG